MQSKEQLIISMEKLIKHISRNSKNQQQIFSSLSYSDFRKILSNLSDVNPKLRAISLNLLSQLISDNQRLKKLFCEMIKVSYMPGKIVVNSFLLSALNIDVKHIVSLLKQPLTAQQYRCNLWYINLNYPKQIHFIENKGQRLQFDPLNNLFGIVANQQHNKIKDNAKISIKQMKNQNSHFSQTIKNEERKNLYHKNKPSFPDKMNNSSHKSQNDYQNIRSINSPKMYNNYTNSQLYSSSRDRASTQLDAEFQKSGTKFSGLKVISASTHKKQISISNSNRINMEGINTTRIYKQPANQGQKHSYYPTYGASYEKRTEFDTKRIKRTFQTSTKY